MEVKVIDLYEYYKVKKPENADGKLCCYILNQNENININRKHPAMLIIPGGGYGHVSGREAEPVALKFLNKDYNAFVLNYSVAPVRFPTQLIEAGMAMAYIRENAQTLNVIPNKIGVVGFSAGGHLAGLISLLHNDKRLDFLKQNNKNLSLKPNATLYMYPVVSYNDRAHKPSFDNLCGDNEELKKSLCLENLVTEDSPPCYIVSTFEDTCVPCQNSLKLATAFDNAKVPFSLHIFEKGCHGMSVGEQSVYNTALNERLMQMAKDFPKWVDMALVWLEERDFKIED